MFTQTMYRDLRLLRQSEVVPVKGWDLKPENGNATLREILDITMQNSIRKTSCGLFHSFHLFKQLYYGSQ